MSKILFNLIQIFVFLTLFNQCFLRTIDEDGAHYFTKYLKTNNLEEAKSKAFVDLDFDTDLKSYSGYFTVDEKCDSNLFAWYFENKNKSAPVILWLNGGPGATSLIGLFDELGPFVVQKDLNLTKREYAWTDEYSVLFVDNPVGAGFSYTSDKLCYARNQNMVADNLYSLLLQFFKIFSHLKDNEFYITGESYAGKYVPSIAHKIHMNRFEALNYFNFVGIAIGDGLIDPINQIDYDEILHQLNYIDDNQQNIMRNKKYQIQNNIINQNWLTAYNNLNDLIGIHDNPDCLYQKFTGMSTYFNFLKTKEDENLDYFKEYLKLESVKKKIHVGNNNLSDGQLTQFNLREDIPKSVAQQLSVIVREYKVLLYNGLLDIIVGPVLTSNFLEKTSYPELKNIISQEKRVLNFNDTEVAGYIKSLNDFHFVVLRNAGHLVPYDQPKNSLFLIKNFIENKLN